MNYIILLLTAAACSILAIYERDFSCMFVPLTFLVLGNLLIRIFAEKRNGEVYRRVYNITSFCYYLYAIACYLYMKSNGFDFLLVSDTATAYIPYTKDFMEIDSLSEMWDLTFNNDIANKYRHVGIITIYFAYVGKYAQMYGTELYFCLQASIIFFSGFVSVFLYKLLKIFEIQHPFRYTLVYSLLSVYFYYSSLILREAPISMFYMIIFCYLWNTDEHISAKNVILILLSIIFTFLLRPEMGIFACIFLLIYLTKNYKNTPTYVVSLLTALAIVFFFFRFDVYNVYKDNQEHFRNILEDVGSASTLNSLNRLPPVVSQIAKVIYIQLSPIPSWSFISLGQWANETNNIMGLPRAIAVFYNYIVWTFFIYFLINIRTFRPSRTDLLLIAAVLIFLFLQTESTEQRRMQACFPIIFAHALVVKQSRDSSTCEKLLFAGTLVFITMQIFGISK